MSRRLQAVAFLVVAAAAGLAGYFFNQGRLQAQAAEATVQRLLLAPLSDLNGRTETLSQQRGKILVVNFWATWCLPCREEIPALMRIQEKYAAKNIEVVGIAVDNVLKVRDFAVEFRVNYRLLMGGLDTLATSKDLGNTAQVLPFTMVLDRSGKLVYTHSGALTEAALDTILMPLI